MSDLVPVLLEDQVFPIVRIVANPKFKPRTPALLENGVESEISTRKTPDGTRRYAVEMRVKVLPKSDDDTSLPYFVDVVGVTFMTLTDTIDEADSEKVALQFGHMILYPAIRELIVSITARQPWGKFSIGLSKLDTEPTPQTSADETPRKPTRRRRKAE